MKKNKYPLFFIILSCVIVFSNCSSKVSVNTIEEYNKWLGNQENGLLQIKKINGYIIKLKLLPANYLAYKEFLDIEHAKGQKQLDSLININKAGLTFLFMLLPDNEKGNNQSVMLTGVSNEQEYNDKLKTMSFNMDKCVELKAGGQSYSPVLSNLENSSGFNNGCSLLFVFSEPKGFNINEGFDFIYNDELFKLGTNHFIFNKESLKNIPQINLKN